MDKFSDVKAQLRECYSLEFPASIFYLADFLQTYPEEELEADLESVRIAPCGLLSLILDPELLTTDFQDSALLHYRYYRDLPEFFTCLEGDHDGLHWGLLLDDPSIGFRGAASYYNNDANEIAVYGSIFSALIEQCESELEGCDEFIMEEPDEEEYYLDCKRRIRKFLGCLQDYVGRASINLLEDRVEGVSSNTGLGLCVPETFWENESPEVYGKLSDEDYYALLNGCTEINIVPCFKTGRSLWYWGGKDNSEKAYNLLKKAYTILQREKLIQILEIHFSDRDSEWVDMTALG